MPERRGWRVGELQPVNEILRRVLPAQYALHIRLEKAGAEWAQVVGPVLCKQSAPLDLVNGELLIAAHTPLVANRLSMMSGNIAQALIKNYQIEIKNVKVIVGQAPPRPAAARRRAKPSAVSVREEDVRALEQSYREQVPGLPEDVAIALARFQAFFTKRFPRA